MSALAGRGPSMITLLWYDSSDSFVSDYSQNATQRSVASHYTVIGMEECRSSFHDTGIRQNNSAHQFITPSAIIGQRTSFAH